MPETLDEDELRVIGEIADAVVEKLNGSVISSVLPAFIGDWVRKTCEQNQLLYRHMIPMRGPTVMMTEWRLNTDGTILLDLQDTNGQTFWRGTFRPESPPIPPVPPGW